MQTGNHNTASQHSYLDKQMPQITRRRTDTLKRLMTASVLTHQSHLVKSGLINRCSIKNKNTNAKQRPTFILTKTLI